MSVTYLYLPYFIDIFLFDYLQINLNNQYNVLNVYFN